MTADVGDQAPDFTLKDQNNQPVTLSTYRGDRAVLLVFYPLAFTGTCQGELTLIRDDAAYYQSPSLQVLTVSVDSPYSHKVWADREGYDFPLLSDFWPHGGVAQSYGVFNERAGFADRGTFLIDRTGTIRFREVQPPGTARDQSAWREAIASLPD